MKKIQFLLAFFVVCLGFATQVNAQTKQATLPKNDEQQFLAQKNALIISQQLVKDGYKKGKLISSTKYSGKDELGAFVIIVVANQYTAAGKSTMEQAHIEVIRGDKKEIYDLADDGVNMYTINANTAALRKVSCDPLAIAKNLVTTGSSCNNCLNKITACINNNKGKSGRIWRTVTCLTVSATPACISCVRDFTVLVNSVVVCLRQ